MRNTVLLLVALLMSGAALSAGMARCGTDDFGNTVCMDKEGVVTLAPPQAASGVPSAGSVSDNMKVRCGIDSFGNKVCR